jgi:phosphoribosylaminoimidazole-succinocarboxamide synthase
VTGIALPHAYTGKIRDLYEVGHDRILMVASDRISVFDVVLDDLVTDKGRVLTALSTFWFEQTAGLAPNHLISSDPTDFPETAGPDVAGRAMLVHATRPVRLECIGRGYLFGSAWSEYDASGTVYGRQMPAGLHQAERLPEPMFTATTKAEAGHDEPLTDAEAADLVGGDLLDQIREITLRVYGFGAARAEERGIILADTQYVRDYYLATDWDHTAPAPRLPDEVVDGTRARYVEAYELLTGRNFDEWYAPEARESDESRQYD